MWSLVRLVIGFRDLESRALAIELFDSPSVLSWQTHWIMMSQMMLQMAGLPYLVPALQTFVSLMPSFCSPFEYIISRDALQKSDRSRPIFKRIWGESSHWHGNEAPRGQFTICLADRKTTIKISTKLWSNLTKLYKKSGVVSRQTTG